MAARSVDHKTGRIGRGRRVLALTGVIACALGCWSSARVGLASYLVGHDDQGGSSHILIDRAIAMSSTDPDLRVARVRWLHRQREYGAERRELETMAMLRPRDYLTWVRLGDACWNDGDTDATLRAYQKAMLLAPYYAQPRWRLGTFLLQLNLTSSAFEELRQAVTSDPSKYGEALELAWQAYGGDSAKVEQTLQLSSPNTRLQLARFLIKKGEFAAGVRLWMQARGSVTSASAEELERLTSELIAANKIKEAYTVWSVMRPDTDALGVNRTYINNGDFEQRLGFDEKGFGWRLTPRDTSQLSISLNTNNPQSGSQSLLIDFSGNNNPSLTLLSQLVPVEANTRYRLQFWVRTRQLIAGGMPVVRVQGIDGQPFAESLPLPKETGGWQLVTVDFMTGAKSQALLIKLERQGCSTGPCPILGQLWLDGFSLQQSTAESSDSREFELSEIKK